MGYRGNGDIGSEVGKCRNPTSLALGGGSAMEEVQETGDGRTAGERDGQTMGRMGGEKSTPKMDDGWTPRGETDEQTIYG